VFWIPFIYHWGRLPVLFWTTLAGTMFTLACCVTDSFDVFYAMRALMGFTFTAGQTVGLAYIQDIFFFHQHARKIGFWAALHLMAPYSAPLLGNFIVSTTKDWRVVFWMVFGLACWDLFLIVLCIDETWYRRDIPLAHQPQRGSRIMRLLGIWQIQNHRDYFLTLGVSWRRVSSLLFKPIIIPIMVY
jgi:MFS family permease